MKLLIRLIIIVAIFFGGFYVGQNPDALGLDKKDDQVIVNQKAGMNLMFDFGNGDLKSYNDIVVEEGLSAFDLTEKVTSENNLEFRYKDYGSGLGVFVESINNFGNNAGLDRFWQLWVNGKYSEIGASANLLNDGDVIEWKYIKGQIN